MDTLCISGSAQFSEPQFRSPAAKLRKCAGGRTVYVFDLRRESHAIVNGRALSQYEVHNWANPGMSLEEIEKDEEERFGSMTGSKIKAYIKQGDIPKDPVTILVKNVLTEKQLSDGLKKTNVGDQMSGLTFTYTVVGDGDTTQKNKEYEILSITLDDGTEVDLKDNKTLYRVCTVDYCASVPGSVFQDKKPVVPVADAPVDVDLYIDVLRKEREENDGYIYVDTGERGIEVAPEDAAGELKKTA